VSFSSLPCLTLSLEQEDIWGPADTGGALWYADRVMAEYLPFSGFSLLQAGLEDQSHGAADGLALVLGSGGVPLSGLVVAALGWDVVLTDLGEVLEQTRRNVIRNEDAIKLACSRPNVDKVDNFLPEPAVHVEELRFGDDTALKLALNKKAGASRLLILCSDCIWMPVLHRPMLETIASALRQGPANTEALVCYQTRSPQKEKMFEQHLFGKDFAFQVERVCLDGVLPKVQWPVQVLKTLHQEDIRKQFVLWRLTLGSK